MQTQWRRNPMTGRLQGFDYTALAAVMDLMEITQRRNTFDRLRVMEREALAALTEQSEE